MGCAGLEGCSGQMLAINQGQDRREKDRKEKRSEMNESV